MAKKINNKTTDLKIGSVLKVINIKENTPYVLNKFYNITDGENPNLQSFIRFIATLHNPYFLNIKLPRFFFIALAKIGDLFPFFPLNSKRLNNLSRVLTFDDQLARRKIKWNGQSVVKSTT